MLPLLRRAEMLLDLDHVLLDFPDGARQPARVSALRRHQGLLLLRLAEFPDRNAVETLRGVRVRVPRDRFEPLPDGEWYEWQLLGLPVRTESGESLGTLDKIHFSPVANDVWETESALIPAVEQFVVSVDTTGDGVVVRDDPGLRK